MGYCGRHSFIGSPGVGASETACNTHACPWHCSVCFHLLTRPLIHSSHKYLSAHFVPNTGESAANKDDENTHPAWSVCSGDGGGQGAGANSGVEYLAREIATWTVEKCKARRVHGALLLSMSYTWNPQDQANCQEPVLFNAPSAWPGPPEKGRPWGAGEGLQGGWGVG